MGSKSGISICSLWKAHTKTVNNSISLEIYIILHFSNYLSQIFRIRSLHDYKKDQLRNFKIIKNKFFFMTRNKKKINFWVKIRDSFKIFKILNNKIFKTKS